MTNKYITDTECTFVFDEVLKHSIPKYHLKPSYLTLRAPIPQNGQTYSDELSECANLDIRLIRSSNPALFIGTTKPFKPVSRVNIARSLNNTKKR